MNRNTVGERWMQWTHQSKGKTHCKTCLALDKCWFAGDNHPRIPHHNECHCISLSIPQEYAELCAKSISPYSKYVPYLFNTDGGHPHGKEKMLASWGYTAVDAHWLQQEIDRQGREKYIDGDYALGKLDNNGQRISIRVEIPRKNGSGMVSFTSGWMVEPQGTIRLTTPYGGK